MRWMAQSQWTNDKSLRALRSDPLALQNRLLEKLAGSRISRRDVLRVTAGVSVGAGLWGPLARAASRFDVDASNAGVRINVGGVPVFEVAADQFDGKPRISCTSKADALRVEVKDARIPGTKVTADLKLSARRNDAGWDGRLEWPGLGFSADFSFERWLMGQPEARGRVDLRSVLASFPGMSVGTATHDEAVFFPNWTFEIAARNDSELATRAGRISVRRAQLELVGPATPPVILASDSKPRTRVWLSGTSITSEAIDVDGATVAFGEARLDALMEAQRGVEAAFDTAVAIESESRDGAAGYLAPPSTRVETADALRAHRLRVSALGDRPPTARADLTEVSRWISRGGLHIEIVCPGGWFDSQCKSGPGSIVVTRMIVPMAGMDHAVFVRRGSRLADDGTTIDVSGVQRREEIDGLAWFDGIHLLGRHVPLTDFDLRMTRGADAFSMLARFNDVALAASPSGAALVDHGDHPIIEFAFGSQHIQEEAIYVTQIPGTGCVPPTDDPFISDDKICILLGIKPGPECDCFLREARRTCNYDSVRRQALALRKPPPPRALGKASARFAADSWLTFDWNADASGRRRIRFDASDLFDWEREATPGTKRFRMRQHPLAAPVSLAIDEQIKLRALEDELPPKRLSQLRGAPDSTTASLIQAPYRLGLAQVDAVPWKMRGGGSGEGLHELWSVRVEGSQLRAIWSPDYRKDFWPTMGHSSPFHESLDSRDRHEIVALTSRFGQLALLGSAQVAPYPVDCASPCTDAGIFVPQPVRAKVLMLTSYGATMRLKGRWAPPASHKPNIGALTVQFWDQNSQLSRDTRVVVEYAGFMVPLGSPATLIKETQRRLVYDPQTDCIVARLVQRFYIRVPQFTRTVPALHQPFEGRGWPFGNITMPAFVTPDLTPPNDSSCEIVPGMGLGQQAFWPRVTCGKNHFVEFPFEDTVTGVKATAPLVFVDNDIVHRGDVLGYVVSAYRALVEDARRHGVPEDQPENYRSDIFERVPEDAPPQRCVARIGAGKIRFAPETKPGETSFRAITMLLDIDIPRPGATQRVGSFPATTCALAGFANACKSAPNDLEESLGGTLDVVQALRMTAEMEGQNQPPFYPHLRQALVEPGQLSVISSTGRVVSLVEIDGPYLRYGFNKDNGGEVFLRFVDGRALLDFTSDTRKSGGFANTTTILSAISRKRGPIGGNHDPRPQVRYRYEKKFADVRVAAAAASPSPPTVEPDDPVAMARQDGADPKEFFGRALGKAKLCGVVTFADIIDVAIKASGSRAPRMLQEVEHSVGANVIRPLAATLEPQIAKLVQKLADFPTLQVPTERVRNALARIQTAPDNDLLALSGELVNAGKALRDQIHATIEDPKTLLPPDALRTLQRILDIQKALTGLDGLDVRGALIAAVTAYVQQQAVTQLDALLAENPRFAQLLQRARELRDTAAALEAAAKQDAMAFLAALAPGLVRVLDDIVDLQAWSLWVDDQRAALRGVVLNCVRTWLTALESSIADAKKSADALAKSVRTTKVELDKLPPDRTDIKELQRAFLEISDIVLAAKAHIFELDAAIAEAKTIDFSNADLKKLDRLANATRATFDAMAKIRRLPELEDILKVVAPQAVRVFYTRWVQAVAGTPMMTMLDDLQKRLGTVVTSAATAEAEAAHWLQVRAEDALSIATKIATGNAQTIIDVVDKAATLYEIDALLFAALDPRVAVKQAMRQLQAAGRQQLVDLVAQGCAGIAGIMATLYDAVHAVVVGHDVESFAATQWLSPALRARITRLDKDLAQVNKAPIATEPAVTKYLHDLDAVKDDVVSAANEIKRIVTTGDISSLVEFRQLLDKALEEIGIPTTARITYDWDTEVNAYPGGAGPIFEPLDDRKLVLHSVAVADLRGGKPPQISLEARLDRFKINLFGGTPFLSVRFAPMTFSAGTGREGKLVVDVENVDFGGQLSFVKELQAWLSEKYGIIVEPWSDGPGVVVGYQFNRDIIQIAAFTLQNVGFGISCVLPFNGDPARFRFTLSQPHKPFLLSAGIYGGGGFVGIQSRADSIEYLEASFEYGLVTAFKFGPATGTGRITAGVYIRISARNAVVSGFFNASGTADIAGLITVSANFRVQIWYEGSTGKVSGAATFSVSFKIGFAEFSYSIGVAYARQGSRDDKKSASSGKTAIAEAPDRILLAQASPVASDARARAPVLDILA